MSANFEYYKIFYWVAKYQNITHAADELHLTQPSVTKAVQKLEEQLNCQLFSRNKRGVRLTPEGDLLFQKIQPACNMIFSAEQEIDKRNTLNSGIVRISANDLAVQFVLLPVIEKYRKLYPNVTLTITRAAPVDLPVALMTGLLDLFVEFNMDVGTYRESGCEDRPATDELGAKRSSIERRVLGTFHDVPIVGPELAFLAGAELSIKELFKYPLIIPTQDICSKVFYEKLFREHGLERKVDMEVSGVARRILLAERNMGISFLPQECVGLQIKNRSLFPLRVREKLLERQLLLLTSRSIPMSIAAKEFMKLLMQNKRRLV